MTITQERTDLSDVESDDAPAWRGSAVSAPIIGHAHGTADGRKLIRHYAREVAALLAEQETAEAARVAECERIASPPGRELAEEQREQAAVMVAEAAALAHRKATAAPFGETPFGAAPCPRLALVASPQVAAGSQGPDSDAARTMAPLGWCAVFVDTVRLAVAGGLRADGSGLRAVDADGRTGRRVKGERVRLLTRCGCLARHFSGLVVATEDGHESLRLAEAAGPGVLRDEADVMASVSQGPPRPPVGQPRRAGRASAPRR